MTQQTDNSAETDIEVLLARARADEADVSERLVARVVEYASREQPRSAADVRSSLSVRDVASGVRRRWQAFGALGGLVAASCLGFWIGINPPGAMAFVVLPGMDMSNTLPLDEDASFSGFGWDIGEI